MKIAINVFPLYSAHKTRGIGYYTHNLIEGLKHDNSLKVQEFINLSDVKDVDVIHYPWFDLFFPTLPIIRPSPTIVTIHDVIPLIFKTYYPVGLRGKINFILQKIALTSCKFVITDSEVSKKDIIKYLKINSEKIIVIPLAADQSFKVLNDTKLIHIKRKYNLPDQFLLYVGDANWVKNLPFLIEGFRQIIRFPDFRQVSLILVGEVFLKNVDNINHPELESLRKVNRLIREFRLESRIVRPGNIRSEELVAFYNLATVYVQPSLYEGFGLPVLQALSCGTPVVSSNRGGLPQVAGEAAIYFDPTNFNQFKSIIGDVLQSKSLQAKLSKLGLKQAEKFSWNKVVEQTKLVYSKATKT